jgi:hypothetical protein
MGAWHSSFFVVVKGEGEIERKEWLESEDKG